jgi:hypothetical protein
LAENAASSSGWLQSDNRIGVGWGKTDKKVKKVLTWDRQEEECFEKEIEELEADMK